MWASDEPVGGGFARTSDHMPYQRTRYYANIKFTAETNHLAPLFVLLCNTDTHGELQRHFTPILHENIIFCLFLAWQQAWNLWTCTHVHTYVGSVWCLINVGPRHWPAVFPLLLWLDQCTHTRWALFTPSGLSASFSSLFLFIFKFSYLSNKISRRIHICQCKHSTEWQLNVLISPSTCE